MKVVILAAGQGERLKPLTNNIPKALLKIGNTTLLEWHLDALRKHGFNDIIIVAGFNREKIYNLVKSKKSDVYIKIVENNIYDKSGTGYSLWLGIQDIDEEIIFMDADLFYEKHIFKYLNDSSNILLVGKVNVDEESVKVTGENNNLREIGKKVSDRYFCYGEAVGIIRFSRKGFGVLKENLKRKVAEGDCKVEWEGILNELSEKIDIEIIDIEDIKWIEIDFKEDYEKAKRIFNEIS